jgi:branched-chain amino acid transport system permease protein
VILVPLEEISNTLLGGKGAGLTFMVYGAIIMVIARFYPSGIVKLIQGHLARFTKAPPSHTGS